MGALLLRGRYYAMRGAQIEKAWLLFCSWLRHIRKSKSGMMSDFHWRPRSAGQKLALCCRQLDFPLCVLIPASLTLVLKICVTHLHPIYSLAIGHLAKTEIAIPISCVFDFCGTRTANDNC
jgi:hypothetical protein